MSTTEVSAKLRLECQSDLVHLQDQPLTVGTKFFLICRSSSSLPADLVKENIGLNLKAEDLYKLQILDFARLTEEQIQLTVASYKVGAHSLKDVNVNLSENVEALIPEVQFEVLSVINPQEPEKEPYGLRDPYTLSVPMSYWIFLAVVFGGVLLRLILFWRAHLKERQELRQLKADFGGKSLVSGCHLRLRSLRRQAQKQIENGKDLKAIQSLIEVAWKESIIYFGLRFERSTLKLSDRMFFKILKSRLRSDQQRIFFEEIRKLRSEMRAFEKRQDIGFEDAVYDFDQLVGRLMGLIGDVDRSLNTEQEGAL